jgi:hypothetical protein
MGGWELWGVLIVGAAVWILGHLLRQGAEEENRRGPGRPPPPARRPDRPPGHPGRPPQPSTELDRFLQEVARRKQAVEQQRSREAAQKQQQQARRQVRPRPETSDRPPRRRGAEAVPEVLPVEPIRRPPSVERPLETRVPVAQPVRRVEAPPPVVAAEVAEVLPAASARVFPPTARQAPAPALQKLAAMLRTRDDLQAAIMLREVLDRPISRRRR